MTLDEIGVISNPGSTRMNKELKVFRRAVESYPGLSYRELASIDDMPSILADFAAKGVRMVILSGGDGTLQAGMTALITHDPFPDPPLMAILPGGRTNMVAEALGMFGSPDDCLRDVVDGALKGPRGLKTVDLPFIRMELTPGAPPVYGAFFGAATIVRGIEFCRRVVYPLGLPNFLSHTVAIIWLILLAILPFKSRNSPMRRDPMFVNFGDSTPESKAYMIVLVTTLNRLILGLSAASNVGEGSLRYTSIEYNLWAVLRAARTFLFGRPSTKLVRGLVRRRMYSVEIRTGSPVTLDGEFFHPDPALPVRLEATEAFRFVRLDDE
ncbi:acylglycerol kinase family protein [Iodidimonas sp. SYSU 1G8]|uniref:diacylglycerol/lipid kinase family protein n=1 Tax=Iodidimonas sp. SYSU 1G8 TaxID=3133967 RepID=UPI0031FE7E98